MPLGTPAVLTPKALDLRAVQGTVNAIRERLQFIEQTVANAAARSNSSTTAGDITALQAQLAQLAARLSSVEGAVGGDSEVELIAGGAIAAGDPVVMVGLNSCAPVDVTDPTAIYAVVGLAQSAAAIGQSVTITRWGNFSVTGGSLDAGRAVYANEGGGLTQYPSYTDVAIPVGVATGTATMWVSPAWPSLRTLGFESGYEDFLPPTTGLVRDAVLLTEDFNAAAAGIAVKTGENDVTTRTLTGTAARVSVANGSGTGGNPTIDIDAAYVGQTSITTLGTIATGTWAGTAIAANRGGTGQTSFAVGDLIYANTTTALAKLPDVATGNALISGGVDTAPSWGKIGLTTHVSGILPEANGGTGSATRPYVLLAGDTMSGDLEIAKATAPVFSLNATANSVQAILQFKTSGATRWVFRKTNTTESGSNSGSDFGIRRYDDAGVFIEDALLITRSTGNVSIPQKLGVTGLITATAGVAGNASTATALQTPRTINGTSFDGTANITVAAAAGTLTGATLAAGVTASSLTSVGTLGSLTVTGAVSAGAVAVTDSTVPANGMYLSAANTLAFSTNSTNRAFFRSTGEFALGVTPVASIKFQVFTASNKNVGILNQSSEATVSGFTDTGSSAPLRVVGNTLFFSGNGSTNHVQVTSGGNLTALVGNVVVDTAGKGLTVKEGSNAKQGTATLVGGTATVNNTSVTANSRIFLTIQSLGTVAAPKAIAVTARTAATSFTITSADATDTSVIAYEIFEPA